MKVDEHKKLVLLACSSAAKETVYPNTALTRPPNSQFMVFTDTVHHTKITLLIDVLHSTCPRISASLCLDLCIHLSEPCVCVYEVIKHMQRFQYCFLHCKLKSREQSKVISFLFFPISWKYDLTSHKTISQPDAKNSSVYEQSCPTAVEL